MGHSSAVGFLAFAFCLVSCVSANTDASAGTDEAKKAVEEAKISTNKICGKTESYIVITKDKLQRVEPFKKKAKELNSQAAEALSQAENALSQVELKEKENGARAIVEKIKNSADTVRTLHENVTGELDKTVASLNLLISETTALKTECEKAIQPLAGSAENSEGIRAKAAAVKAKDGELEKIVNATVQLINGVDSTAMNMKQSLKEAQLENLHVNVIVDVEKIANMMGGADSAIQETQEKKNTVSGIVQEMLNLKTTAPTQSNGIIEPLYKSANDALTNATRAVQHATNAKAMMTQLNGHADAAIKNITAAKTEKRDVQKEVTFAKAFVRAVERTALQLQSALQTADDSVTNANDLKQKLVTALSTTTSKPRREQNTQTAKSDISVGQGTGPGGREAAIQPKGENSEILKDKLHTGVQNVPTTALTGGKAPAPGAKNDSAMTVSVPLLVALIASAVLQ